MAFLQKNFRNSGIFFTKCTVKKAALKIQIFKKIGFKKKIVNNFLFFFKFNYSKMSSFTCNIPWTLTEYLREILTQV